MNTVEDCYKAQKEAVKPGEATKDKKDSIEYSAQKPSNKISLKQNLEDTDNENETPDVKKSNISLKRNIEDGDDKPDEKDSKKPKIKLNELEKPKAKEEFVSLQLFRDFMEKNEIKILTRADLEAFALQKMCEVFNEKSKCAELVRIVKKQQEAVDSLRQKYASADKQIRDMNIVLNRVMAELRKENGTAKDVQPVKIRRSVGIQVCVAPVAVQNIKPSASDVTPQSNFQQSPAQLQQQQQPTQRRRILRNNSMNRQQTTPPATRPGPASSKLQPQQQRGAGIKTILPKTPKSKTSSSTNGQILGSYLQQRSPTTPSPQAATRKPITPQPQQQQPVATPINNTVEKVIDLTDEDDRPATKNNTPSTTATTTNETTNNLNSSTTNTLSVMLPKQQSGAGVTSSMPRSTYFVSSTGQQVGQPVLLATSASTRPGQARNTLMFKPVPAGEVPLIQRLNIVRPGVTVIPQQQQSIIRAQQPQATFRFTSPRVPLGALTSQNQKRQQLYHPAPLPALPAIQPSQPHWKAMPPKPNLKITQVGDGIVLSWKILNRDMSQYEDIASYQLYSYQETSAAPSTDMWRKVGDMKALALPMACTLTQFIDGNKYHFAVRAVDVKTRVGPFSPPKHISLQAR